MRCLVVFFLCILPHLAFAISLNAPPPVCELRGGDGRVVLYHFAHQELREVQYRRADGGWDDAALVAINRLMRSPGDDAITPIDRRLIQLLDQIQDHFGVDVVEIISGYRSPAYNGRLKAEGRAVASDSRHMEGDAADVHLDDITEEAVRDYAQSLHCGGVGFYPALHFVHVDLGPVRTWSEPRGARKLVGEAPIVIETDRNVYREGDTVQWKYLGLMALHIQLQHFVRGTWRHVTDLHTATTRTLTLHAGYLGYGKYRLRSDLATAPDYSNEFYFKKN